VTNDSFRDKLQDRRAEIFEKVAERSATIKDLAAENRIDLARADEITYALEAADLVSSAAQSAPAAPPEKPPEKAPREVVADRILYDYRNKELPQSVDDFPTTYHAGCTNLRTLRAALNLAHKRRTETRASGEAAEPRDHPPVASSGPAGAGLPLAETVDQVEADRPKFLARAS
jgi:hypothetical protein